MKIIKVLIKFYKLRKMCRTRLFFALSLIALFFLWSSSYTAVALALKNFSPEGLALFRFLIASALLFILSFKYKVRLPDKKDLPLILTCGALGISACSIILFYGQKTTPVAISSVLLNTYPVFVAMFSFLIFKELINMVKIAGILVCFIGIVIVSGVQVFNFSFNGSMLLLIVGAIIVSLYDIEQKHLMKKYTPFELTCYFIWSGTLFLLVFYKTLLNDISGASFNSLLPAVYLGAFPSVVASLIWGKLILNYSVSSLACCCYITPFFAMLIAFLFLHQTPSSSAVIGCFVVIAGLFVSNFSQKLCIIRLKTPSEKLNPKKALN